MIGVFHVDRSFVCNAMQPLGHRSDGRLARHPQGTVIQTCTGIAFFLLRADPYPFGVFCGTDRIVALSNLRMRANLGLVDSVKPAKTHQVFEPREIGQVSSVHTAGYR